MLVDAELAVTKPVVVTLWPGVASRISAAVPPLLTGAMPGPVDWFELVTWTLPVELDAELIAAKVAAVERSPETAANEA